MKTFALRSRIIQFRKFCPFNGKFFLQLLFKPCQGSNLDKVAALMMLLYNFEKHLRSLCSRFSIFQKFPLLAAHFLKTLNNLLR
ncbi:hypothetical protein EGI11_07105 [Chryseobacterium sp. H3056]|uniref:Uncharacterized protein n=1 Tax=Kaistella daneshvariae TaxID=2487074 RepID=A0A3N0WWN0_9FLAO|nr:hypothetical protein EGI11_07105 [Kaistella daneshvariae]